MDISIYDVALVPLTMGVVEVAKGIGISPKYAPVVSLVVGVILGVATTTNNRLQGIVVGMAVGLSSVGLYSGTKNIVKNEGGKIK